MLFCECYAVTVDWDFICFNFGWSFIRSGWFRCRIYYDKVYSIRIGVTLVRTRGTSQEDLFKVYVDIEVRELFL